MLVGPEKYQSSLALMKVDALECQKTKKTLHVELIMLPMSR